MDFLGVVGSLLGGLFGGDSSDQSYTRHSVTDTTATAQDLSDPLLAQLENLFTTVIGGGGFERAGTATNNRLNQLVDQANAPQFDVNAFAKGITDQATAGAQLDLESSINGLLGKSGITESGNSAGALLANKLKNQTAANLAGINQQAVATGEQIRQSQQGQITEGIRGLSGDLANQILSLIQQTRGARQAGTSHSVEDSSGTGTASSSSNPFSALGDFFSGLRGARSAA